jgi:ubiquinone/menaquinone biosynthesis C-methylase UbiE
MFEVGEAYETVMGRWSRQLAPVFVEFVGVRDGEKVLDIGCGTGALSATLADLTRASKIVGIDSSGRKRTAGSFANRVLARGT